MVELFDERVGEIAVIHAVPAGKYEHPLPTVFFYHGYCSSKEVYAYFGYALAKAGFRVILPDAAQHGERYHGDEQRRLAQFWDILKSNIDELPALQTHFAQRGLIDGARIGVAGASMGGMTTLGALTRYPWITAAASLMGSGSFTSLSRTLFPPLDAHGQPLADAQHAAYLAPLADDEFERQWDKLAERPLLLWHGEADDVVPAAESLRLAQVLRERGLAERLTVAVEAGVKHRITPAALDACVGFFRAAL